jgi:hypothetical protein
VETALKVTEGTIHGMLHIHEPAHSHGGSCGYNDVNIVIVAGKNEIMGDNSLRAKITRLYHDSVDHSKVAVEEAHIDAILECEEVKVDDVTFLWKSGDETTFIHSTDD